ncbi:Dyp-type peroxidase [Humibacter ginsenosidimutans]|uniref:Dyp-type peroxidase n=1 Tax=Humibacter ginsenosidimutans TaxID=2599293 RepID=A0A5B8M5Q6_9MICO|nr:Dyp-type peroxidase [Humibacter ginsenosidimutans]QDZ15957.1 Dyp-type peroxidase [Humibacter ginsenosidimutans]
MSSEHRDRVPIDAQSVDAPLSRFAVFLVVSAAEGDDALATVREVVSGVDDLLKTVGFRDLGSHLSCVVGIGRRLWDRLVPGIRPVELEVFPTVRGDVHTAPSTPGDLLFHIRAERVDLCFELERLILDALGSAVRVEDETQGFRYFDVRDLLGFVDGTANPIGDELQASAIIGDDDPAFAGGSYVVVQKYVHDLPEWGSLTVEEQETVIGRTKLENIELDDSVENQKAHKTLTTINDDNGDELDILRDNMPFGTPGSGEMGTYFIGYSARLWVTMKMIDNMFIGDPPGFYDKILDVSRAATGGTFFVPSNGVLHGLDDPDALVESLRALREDASSDAPSPMGDDAGEESKGDGTLGIGSLRESTGRATETEGT